MALLLTSAEAADHLGVGVSAVKRWADAGELPCVRTAGGHRRFAIAELADFRGRQAHPGRADAWARWLAALADPSGPYAVMALLFEARAATSSWPEVLTLVGRLLVEMGERWTRGELTVADEHVASATLTRALAVIAETIPVGRTAPRCVLASAEGDDHTFGLALAEICLRDAGWMPRWIGAPTTTAHLVEHLRHADVRMVALSASSRSSDRRALARQARRVAAACRASGATLVLGGAGPWPETVSGGVRLHTWDEFAAVTRSRASGLVTS
jgi:excisionase family DNA binding protein